MKTISIEQKIEEAITQAKQYGITIVRGSVFVWSGRWSIKDGYLERPILKGCDALGAVLWINNLAEPMLLKGIDYPVNNEWKKIYSILNKDQFWWDRFRFGWSQGRALQLYSENDGKRKYFDDSVSKLGLTMFNRLK